MSIAVGILAWALISVPMGVLFGRLMKSVSSDYRAHLDPQASRPIRSNVVAFRPR